MRVSGLLTSAESNLDIASDPRRAERTVLWNGILFGGSETADQ